MNYNMLFRIAALIVGFYILSIALGNLSSYVGILQAAIALFLIVLGVYPRAVSAILRINIGNSD